MNRNVNEKVKIAPLTQRESALDLKKENDQTPRVSAGVLFEEALDAPFVAFDLFEKRFERVLQTTGQKVDIEKAKNQLMFIRRAYFSNFYDSLLGRASQADLHQAKVEYDKALVFMRTELDTVGNLLNPTERIKLTDALVQADAKRLRDIQSAFLAEERTRQEAMDDEFEIPSLRTQPHPPRPDTTRHEEIRMPSGVVSVRLDGRIERLGETSYTHKQQEAMGAAARAYLERSKSALPERKHSLVGTLAHFLIRNPIGRAMKGALAATAFFAITTTETAHEPQQRPAVEDMRSEAFANTGMETNNFMAIDIPATGALDALKDVIAHANDYPWVTTWLEQVRQKQGGDRSITRAQRLYWAGENIGVLNYSPDQMDENGLWTPHSPHIPKGAWLRLDEQGLSLRMPDGSVHTLITVEDSGQPRVTRYAE